jgi:hypothetical protein
VKLHTDYCLQCQNCSITVAKAISSTIWGSRSGGYEDFYLLGHNAMYSIESQPMFQWSMSQFFAWLILKPWRWRWHVPPKHRLAFNGLHGVISQNLELFYFIYIIKRWYTHKCSCTPTNVHTHTHKHMLYTAWIGWEWHEEVLCNF